MNSELIGSQSKKDSRLYETYCYMVVITYNHTIRYNRRD